MDLLGLFQIILIYKKLKICDKFYLFINQIIIIFFFFNKIFYFFIY
jgi:hypothetical protein